MRCRRPINKLAVGDSVTFAGSFTGGAAWYRGSVMRLNDMMFLVRSVGFSRDSMARHHLGLMARLRPIEVDVNAAVTTQGLTTVRGDSVIDGNDRAPYGWGGYPTLLPPVPGIHLLAPAASLPHLSTSTAQKNLI